jgi:protein-S-isoprenylcysteine O-methyltransferase Ste14
MTFITGRGVPVLLFGVMALSNLTSAIQGTGDVMVYRLLAAALWTMFLVMVLRRPRPVARNRSLISVAAALASCVATIPLGLAHTIQPGSRLLVADVLLIGGGAFSLYAVATLGRCFSVLADARAVISNGPYRLVRHPLYLGELATMLGFVVASRDLVLTITCWLAISAIQAVRAHYEERTLTQAFPEYQAYADAVQYRIVPYVY